MPNDPTAIDPWTRLPYGGTVIPSPNPAATTNPTPTNPTPPTTGGPQPTPPTPAPTYSRLTPEQQAQEDAANKTINQPYTADQRTADENAMIATRRQQQQAQIDAINAGFDVQAAAESKAGGIRMQQTNAENVARGLMGAPEAVAASAGTSVSNTAAMNAIGAQRSATIAGILGNIDAQAIKDADAAHADAVAQAQGTIKNIEDQITARKADQVSAQANFSDLAKASTLSWDDLSKQSPDYAAKILQQTGYDPLQASVLFNNLKSQGQKNQYMGQQFDQTTGIMTMISQDPTGKYVEQQIQMPKPPDGLDFNSAKTSPDGMGMVIPPKQFSGDPSTWGHQIMVYQNGKFTPADEVNNSTTPTPGNNTGAGGVVSTNTGDNYDISNYATNPQNAAQVQSILSTIGQFKSPQEIDKYIQSKAPGSPLTGQMVIDASSKAGVSWEMMTAMMQNESVLGTSNVAKTDNNVAGITWTQSYQDANPGVSKGSPRPAAEGGNYVKFPTLQAGAEALATNLAARKSNGPIQAAATPYDAALKGKTPQQVATFNSFSDIDKSNVSQLLAGDATIQDLMTSRGVSGNAAKQQLLDKARQIDPSFSEVQSKQRVTFKTQWNNPQGNSYNVRLSGNTAIGHLATLAKWTDQLQNNDKFKSANTVGQFIADNINTPGISEAVANYDDTMEKLAHELASFYAKGGAPDVTSIANERAILDKAKPADILHSIIDNNVSLLSSKVAAQGTEYKNVMGDYPDQPIINLDNMSNLKSVGVDISEPVSIMMKQGYDVPDDLKTTNVGGTDYVLHDDGKYYPK